MLDNQRQYLQAIMQMKNFYSAALNTPLVLPYFLNSCPENLVPQFENRPNPHSQAFLPYNQRLLGSRPTQTELWQLIYGRMAAAEAQNLLKANLKDNSDSLQQKPLPIIQAHSHETHSVTSESKELEGPHDQMITYTERRELKAVKIENESEASCEQPKAAVDKVSASKKM